MKALTLRHPWAFAIAFLGKDVENREWDERLAELMGIHAQVGQRIAIHGGAAPERPKRGKHWRDLSPSNLWAQHCEALEYIQRRQLGSLTPQGVTHLTRVRQGGPLRPEHFICTGVIAVATVQRLTRDSTSPWAVPGQLHIELGDVQVLPNPVQCTGKQGLWDLGEDLTAVVERRLTEYVPLGSDRTGEEWLR